MIGQPKCRQLLVMVIRLISFYFKSFCICSRIALSLLNINKRKNTFKETVYVLAIKYWKIRRVFGENKCK